MITTKLHLKLAEKKMSQSQLAKATGIRQPTISAYCNDSYKQISKDHLDILCKYFECDISDILEFKNEDENEDNHTELLNFFNSRHNSDNTLIKALMTLKNTDNDDNNSLKIAYSKELQEEIYKIFKSKIDYDKLYQEFFRELYQHLLAKKKDK